MKSFRLVDGGGSDTGRMASLHNDISEVLLAQLLRPSLDATTDRAPRSDVAFYQTGKGGGRVTDRNSFLQPAPV